MRNLVVARYRDGRVIKGIALDVTPGRTTFHVRPESGGPGVQVEMHELKALFFVRDLAGDPARVEKLEPDPGDPRSRGASIVRLVFDDGEVVVALSNAYPPRQPYFFVVPVDKDSNNTRILVNGAAVVSVTAIVPDGGASA
jgi:hypothetical protein